MSKLEDIQVNTLLDEIRTSLNKALEGELINEATKINPVKWENKLGDFKYDGEHLYYKPNKPIESVKIDFKIIKNG